VTAGQQNSPLKKSNGKGEVGEKGVQEYLRWKNVRWKAMKETAGR